MLTAILTVFLGTCFISNVNAKVKVDSDGNLVFSKPLNLFDDEDQKLKNQQQEMEREIKKQRQEIIRQEKEMREMKRKKILKEFGLPTFID